MMTGVQMAHHQEDAALVQPLYFVQHRLSCRSSEDNPVHHWEEMCASCSHCDPLGSVFDVTDSGSEDLVPMGARRNSRKGQSTNRDNSICGRREQGALSGESIKFPGTPCHVVALGIEGR